MTFRDRLLATIRAAAPVLEDTGALIVGSEVPNLLQADVASTLVVSQDLDVGVLVGRHAAAKERLPGLGQWFEPSRRTVGVDSALARPPGTELRRDRPFADPAEAYVFEDDRLPLLVFGALSLVTPGAELVVAGTRIRLPRPAGLLLEKLVTDRTGEKGDRDLLVALGLLMTASPADHDEFHGAYRGLRPELRHAVRSNLTLLSLTEPRAGMPDPRPWRRAVAALLHRLDGGEMDPT